MVTDPSVPPIECQEKIEKELDRMVDQGIIMLVTEPSEWVNSITYPVKPNTDLHICLDPKDLNKAIIKEHYKALTFGRRNHPQTQWCKEILKSRGFQRIFCLSHG